MKKRRADRQITKDDGPDNESTSEGEDASGLQRASEEELKKRGAVGRAKRIVKAAPEVKTSNLTWNFGVEPLPDPPKTVFAVEVPVSDSSTNDVNNNSSSSSSAPASNLFGSEGLKVASGMPFSFSSSSSSPSKSNGAASSLSFGPSSSHNPSPAGSPAPPASSPASSRATSPATPSSSSLPATVTFGSNSGTSSGAGVKTELSSTFPVNFSFGNIVTSADPNAPKFSFASATTTTTTGAETTTTTGAETTTTTTSSVGSSEKSTVESASVANPFPSNFSFGSAPSSTEQEKDVEKSSSSPAATPSSGLVSTFPSTFTFGNKSTASETTSSTPDLASGVSKQFPATFSFGVSPADNATGKGSPSASSSPSRASPSKGGISTSALTAEDDKKVPTKDDAVSTTIPEEKPKSNLASTGAEGLSAIFGSKHSSTPGSIPAFTFKSSTSSFGGLFGGGTEKPSDKNDGKDDSSSEKKDSKTAFTGFQWPTSTGTSFSDMFSAKKKEDEADKDGANGEKKDEKSPFGSPFGSGSTVNWSASRSFSVSQFAVADSSDEQKKTAEKETKLPTEKVVTGEEGEECIHSIRAKVYALDKESKQWRERGSGQVHLNVDKTKENQARMVMRVDSTHRLVLNSPIYSGMKADQDKTNSTVVRLNVVNHETSALEPWLFRFTNKGTKKDDADNFVKFVEKYQALAKASEEESNTTEQEQTAEENVE